MSRNGPQLLLNRYDWSENPTEAYEFRTSVFQSRNYSETRVAQRVEPRRSISFQSTEWTERFRRNFAQLTARGHNLFLLPSGETLTSDGETAAEETEITIVAATLPVRPGEIVEVAGTFQTVVAATATTVTIAEPLAEVLPSGSLITRHEQFRFEAAFELNTLSDSVSRQSLNLNFLPGLSPLRPPQAAGDLFEGREVFTRKNDWRSDVQYQMTPVFESVDYEFGVVRHRPVLDYMPYTFRELHTFTTVAQKTAMIDFFRRQRGRQGDFWKPSPIDTFELAVAPQEGDVSLNVAGDFLADYVDRPDRLYVFVELFSGEIYPAKITEILPFANNAFLTLDTPWTISLDSFDIRRAGFLDLCRLGTDTLTITNRSGNISETTLAFYALRQDEDE